MRCPVLTHLALILTFGTLPVSAADFATEAKAAMARVAPQQKEFGRLMRQGHVADANARLLALFPEKSRTPAESYVLGNMLFAVDPKLSYALHQDASKRLPDEVAVQLEWAMEQHRSGEYAGALAAYDAFSKANPGYAPVHGLAADCLIRGGRIAEAVARWKLSEEAQSGSLERFETMVCEIYRDYGATARRPALRLLAEQHDSEATMRLIVLDCDYPHDWWNGGVHAGFLAEDLPLVDLMPPGKRTEALKCLGACGRLEGADGAKEADYRAAFLAHGLLIDDRHSLSPDPAVSALLISSALQQMLLTKEEAKGWFIDTLIAQAHQSSDTTLWNLVAFLLEGDDVRLLTTEQEAWKATGDARFAVGYLVQRQKLGGLKPDDPDLVAAVAQFPESGELASLALECAPMPTAELLVRAIKAEYRHFSREALGFRPSARPLRSYFKSLAKMLP